MKPAQSAPPSPSRHSRVIPGSSPGRNQEAKDKSAHPWPPASAGVTKFRGSGATHAEAVTETPAYAELQVTTNFSFLRGASHPAELVLTAAALGHRAIAVTDHNSVAGIVRAHQAAKEVGHPSRRRLPARSR